MNKELLEYLYVNHKLSIDKIMTITTKSRNTIYKYLHEYDIPIRNQHKKYVKFAELDENFFNIIDTQEKAYILGFILGDGIVSHNKGISISLAEKDIQILEDIADAMGARKYLYHTRKVVSTEQNKIHLPLQRMNLTKDIVKQGVPYSPKSSIEPFIELQNKNLQWHFIRGMFDADGCIRVYQRGKYKKYKFCITSSKMFCEGFKTFIENEFKITLPLKCIQHPKGCYVIEFSSKLMISLLKNKLYENATIYLKRKKKIFDLSEGCKNE